MTQYDSIKIVPHRGAGDKPHVCKSAEPEGGPGVGAWERYNARQEKLFQRFMSAIRSGDPGRSRAREYRESITK